MYEKFDFGPDTDRIVYVREVEMDELPDDVRAQVPGAARLYAVHRADGERLALVRERAMAFALARQNDLTPFTAH